MPCVVCTGKDHLDDALKDIEDQDGEGIMLREPGSAYVHGTARTGPCQPPPAPLAIFYSLRE